MPLKNKKEQLPTNSADKYEILKTHITVDVIISHNDIC